MKKISILILVIAVVFTAKPCYAQPKLTVKDLVGVWQYGAPVVGDELNQSLVFFNNGNFYFNNGNLSADLISTLNLKGRYRLENNKIFFTIVSKAIVDSADIGVKEPALYFGIFDYENIVSKVIIIKNPKEIKDPATIVVIKPNHLQINNMDYYKVSSNPDDADKL